MPRAVVTSSLAETLRSLRLQNKIPSKQLASHINKSPAYISKLENGSIQTIDTKELYAILEFISGEEPPVDLADQIYKTLTLKYSPKEIEAQLWFVNYDTVNCLLPVPSLLIDEFNSRIELLGISRKYLAERINANEALSEEERLDNSIPFNEWYHPEQLEGNAQCIKIRLSEKRLNRILDKQDEVEPYVFIFCILYYLLKIEKYKDSVSITEEQNHQIMQEAAIILNSFKFLSISEKNRLISERQSQEEIQEVLSSFDRDNIDILGDIISSFQFASEHNIKSTNEQLKAFGENMHWDLGFMLRIISINYASLQETSISNRKKLLSEIEALVKHYSELSKDQNRIETY